MNRKIKFYKKYFIEFYLSLDKKVQEKIEYVFQVIRKVDRIPSKFLKHIENTDGLYKIRINSGSIIYRVFCCFDGGRVVILFNGFQKKRQKTRKREIEKALRLKNEYFEDKKGWSNEKDK